MRSGIRALVPVVILLASLAACTTQSDKADSPTGTIGSLPDAARQIMAKPAYAGARWLYYVADPNTGKAVLANAPDQLVFTGSTAKEFTIGTVYDTLGTETRLTTPVYASAPTVAGTVSGNLVLVASGDLTLGGRGALQGKVDHTFTATSVDHVYGDIAPNTTKVADDPLAGLNDLAHQVAAKGITRIDGDVVIDTRIWETFKGQEGLVPPIFVNDNILDIDVTPGDVGQLASIATTPQTSAFTVESKVTTADTATGLQVAADPNDPRHIVVTGTVAPGKPAATIYRIPDAASWARTLFVEALGRAGVTVAAPALSSNNEAGLPAPTSYPADRQVAAFQSPTMKAFGSMILETSYNTGANAMMCLLAVEAGSTDCTAGLKTIRDEVEMAGLNSNEVVLVDGQGADPASTTPKQMAAWMQWAAGQSWGPDFVAGQPILGVTGSLASSGADSPAKGKVLAKTGTSAAVDPATGRALFNVQSLAGYLVRDNGKNLVFGLSMSGGTYPDVLTGLHDAGDDVAMVAAAIQQAFEK
ncbi:D-alanyl-D-alanine carboxypeptidase/D-alanyl-D-alanine-endopeptidase [Antrihabitans cavernicola]|uniref:D-alanyl-D-alanine carboxypeptidase/D-alanyl-D-alanine-endopeptidase n=1 Tax=Antrihabitans cavernicola TaxID=2495913 RepID=UPI001F29D1C8|nr:D-alanyl-D-alanine carboxypeptidase [Spelaeibacter cavernicola]